MVIHADNTMIQGFSAKVFQNNLAKSKNWLIAFLGWVLLNAPLKRFSFICRRRRCG